MTLRPRRAGPPRRSLTLDAKAAIDRQRAEALEAVRERAAAEELGRLGWTVRAGATPSVVVAALDGAVRYDSSAQKLLKRATYKRKENA